MPKLPIQSSILLSEETKERLFRDLAGLDDETAKTLRSLVATIEEKELLALLGIAIEHAVETHNEDLIHQLDRWVHHAKLALNATEESIERNDADETLSSSIDQLS